MNKAQDRLIVALDVAGEEQARALVATLGDSVSYYKVGKELFTACGPGLVRELVAGGKKVFLDLKFHDIPNTVAGAVRSAAALGVSLLTVHASGGSRMLAAAAQVAAQSAARPTVLAVTVLTSLDAEALAEVGVPGPVKSQVERLAGLALKAGCGGLVSSAQEARRLRERFGHGFALVTPGIRPAGGEAGDQARVVTPSDAIRDGASYLVVGRPVTGAADPRKAAEAIVAEIAAASQPL